MPRSKAVESFQNLCLQIITEYLDKFKPSAGQQISSNEYEDEDEDEEIPEDELSYFDFLRKCSHL